MDNIFIKTNQLPNWIDSRYFRGTDLASIEDLISIIEDLKDDYDILEEKYKDLEQDVHDNYKFIEQKDQIGYDERTW